MKMWKRFLTYMFAAVLCFGLAAGNVQAAGNTTARYTYTVTFYAGNQGDFKEEVDVTVTGSEAVISRTEDKVVVSGLAAGAEVGITAQDEVALDASSKYYVKGIRLSGRDNASVAASVFKVNGDADYVVAYGIKGNQVSYTVNYQDVSGRELAPSDTFYGNVGDKPVVAYRYISGYSPLVYGFTKTLSENEAENVFTFVYGIAMEGNDNVIYKEGDTVIVYVDRVVDGVSIVQGAGGNAGNDDQGAEDDDNESTGSGDDTGDNEGTEEGTGTGEDSGTDDDITDDDTSDVIVDLDDEDVPLAQPDQDKSTVNMAVVASLAGVSLAALLAVILMIFRAKRLKSNEEAE